MKMKAFILFQACMMLITFLPYTVSLSPWNC